MIENKITIITPTYNRSHTLGKVYESLIMQSNMNFRWLIIDDGSEDNTKGLVNTFNTDLFSIDYVHKINGGKASALNVAFDLIDTEFFSVLDSDDTFTKNAIDKALGQLIRLQDEDDIIGVMNLRHDFNQSVLGGKEIPKSVEKIRRVDLQDIFEIHSEIIVFYKTIILNNGLRYPFFEGEKFISPSYFEFEATKDKYFKVVHEVFCYCEYLEDGLTKNKLKIIKQNPKGYTLVKRQAFMYSYSFKQIVKQGIMYIAGAILAKNRNFIKDSPRKILTIFLIPFGFIAYLIKFRK